MIEVILQNDGSGLGVDERLASLPVTFAACDEPRFGLVPSDRGAAGRVLVIEDDVDDGPTVFAVRPGDYRRLFTRLRRGDR